MIADQLIENARTQKQCVLLMIDDYHTIHTIPRPTSGQTSTAIHMATCLADIHTSVPSISLPTEPIHYMPTRSSVRGMVNTGRVVDYFESNLATFFSYTWMESVPEPFLKIDTSDIVQSLENMR